MRSLWISMPAAGITITFAAAFLPHTTSSHSVLAFSKQTQAAGSVIFHEKGCEHCHGIDGIGTDRGPDLSGIGKRWKKNRIETQIRDGGGGMPPFGSALQPDEVEDLVDYLAAKRKSSKQAPQLPVKTGSHSEDSGL